MSREERIALAQAWNAKLTIPMWFELGLAEG
jgi:hypothetical protein